VRTFHDDGSYLTNSLEFSKLAQCNGGPSKIRQGTFVKRNAPRAEPITKDLPIRNPPVASRPRGSFCPPATVEDLPEPSIAPQHIPPGRFFCVSGVFLSFQSLCPIEAPSLVLRDSLLPFPRCFALRIPLPSTFFPILWGFSSTAPVDAVSVLVFNMPFLFMKHGIIFVHAGAHAGNLRILS